MQRFGVFFLSLDSGYMTPLVDAVCVSSERVVCTDLERTAI